MSLVWRMIRTKSANDKIAKCNCGNAHSAPSHNLYGTHENSIPFLHRDLAAAHFTSLSLLNRETCLMFGCLSNLSSIYLRRKGKLSEYHQRLNPALSKPDTPDHDLPLMISLMLGRSTSLSSSFFTTTSPPSCLTTTSSSSTCPCVRV